MRGEPTDPSHEGYENDFFYVRNTKTNGLNTPIHIDFESYKASFNMGGREMPNPCTFLVTVDTPSISPRGLTCRVSGTNFVRSHEGVQGGVVAQVKMVKQDGDGSAKRVIVKLLEDGRTVGHLIDGDEATEMTSLEGVSFMPGDTVFLDPIGERCDPSIEPRLTEGQERLLEQERQRIMDMY